RSLYNQLTAENSHEKFDERRITMLKSQVIQLERQVLLMSESLSSRSEVLLEVENALSCLVDKWRYYIAVDVKGPEVGVQRADITQMVHTAESARIKLYKSIENSTTEKLNRTAILLDDFIKPGCQGEITLLDIASGKLDHLNLKHVGKLETKLASLYKELIGLYELMNEGDRTNLDNHYASSSHVTNVARDRLGNQILKSCALMKDCCGDLTSLSLLYPAAPWPPFKRSAVKDITLESVLKALPPLPRGRTADVHKTLEALVKAVNYKHHMMEQQVKALKDDVKFHKSVYNLQLSYIESLFHAMKEGYEYLERSTDEVIVTPLKEILEAYSDLKETASEEALKNFLTNFEHSFEKIDHAVNKLSLHQENGTATFSQFGEEFYQQLDILVKKCQSDRDKAALEKEEVREQVRKSEDALQKYLTEQEYKYKDRSALDVEECSENISTHRQDVLIYVKDKDKDESIKKDDNIVVVESTLQDSVLKEFEQSLRHSSVSATVPVRKPWNDSTVVDEPAVDEVVSVDNDSLPPQGNSQIATNKAKKKKPKNYVPNTFVPNRTLELRRSGSMSKLDEAGLKPKKPPFLPKMNRPSSSSDSVNDDNDVDIKSVIHSDRSRSDSRTRPRSRDGSDRVVVRSTTQRSNSKSRKS
ncbi:hypothetical protein FSP39_016676, partial [Pinctada imbricata]